MICYRKQLVYVIVTMPPISGPQPNHQQQFVIGGISVIDSQVHTAVGTAPLKECNFSVQDNSRMVDKTPTYASVLAILSFFVVCFIGLLFLLIKEQVITGYIEVTVQGPDGYHFITQVPSTSPHSISQVSSYVNQMQAASARLRR